MHIGFFLFDGVTQLDFTGPYDVLARIPGVKVSLFGPPQVRSELGLVLGAGDPVTPVDVLMVPGGPGIKEVLASPDSVESLRKLGETATWVTSVCTGALALGKAGLLRGYRATTHWAFLELLSLVGAEPVAERVVVDRNRVTGAGVTSGIDFALRLVKEMVGPDAAEDIRWYIEYDPSPLPPMSAAMRQRFWQATEGEREERRQLLMS